ncbi:probable magnesium transporter NIPA9 [Andrographis paniculata]|uniref:probable magnesium transporter NIPA9 n=1 Tax=Andrographis paniculata TaxID=175694 RepID=UPI0021E7A457|nr:probable magnesium transporter NIPA9 [Andrographis paniculata]
MWEAICLAVVASAGNNIGKVLQKKATLILPPFSFKLKVVRAYASNRAWIAGFLMDILGAVLMLLALSQAPVSVVQPVSGCGLAVLSLFSHIYLKETMNVVDWFGIVLAVIGTIGVGAGGEEQKTALVSISHLPILAFSICFVFLLLNGFLRVFQDERREHELLQFEVVEEIIYGLESGILFGLASVVSKMGFLFFEHGYSASLLLICMLISTSFSASGLIYQTRGLKHGRAIVVSTCGTVSSITTGVIAGVFAMGERLPSAPLALALLLLGWFFIVLGVILLVTSSKLLRYLPGCLRPITRRGGWERSFGAKQYGSSLVKEANPSAVIHASTLHNLLSSPSLSKAKA